MYGPVQGPFTPFLTTYPANKSSPIQLPIHSSIFTKILIFRHPLLSPLPIPLFLPPPLQHPIQLALSLPCSTSRSIFPSIHPALPRSRHYFPPFGVCVITDSFRVIVVPPNRSISPTIINHVPRDITIWHLCPRQSYRATRGSSSLQNSCLVTDPASIPPLYLFVTAMPFKFARFS